MSLDVLSSEAISDTERFIGELRDRYLQEPVVYNDLLDRRIGGDKFGQLGLIKGHGGCLSESEGMKRSWNMLRGKLDNIMNVSEKIDIQDVLKHNDDNSPIKVVVDGPPGVGKTTLCHKLCNTWAKNELRECSFDLVFAVSLRDEEVSSAKNISDLVSLFHSCDNMSEKIKQTNGKDMLIIFDGWDEFKGKDQNTSFILDVIQGSQLHKCNVLVTSRTYASAKLLQLHSVNRHVEVLGFEEEEIFSYIRNELTEDNAEQLIEELEIREDVLSLCYIPFVCSMLVRVYQLCDYTLPNTLTKFYKKYVLYAVKRSMKKKELDPDTVESLEELQEDQKRAFDELCCCAYEKLKTQNTTFNRNEILKLSNSLKWGHFGLMNCYKIADTTKHQFLHLTIQEFLAAWWITHREDQKVLFGEHFQDIHFRMSLRFVAGLTELKDDSYQEYFSKEVDLQCVTRPLFGFESHQCSVFHQNPQMLHECVQHRGKYPLHQSCYDTDTIQLLHLIYESQNKILCQKFASSIKNSSICVDRVISSQFDLLCLSFLLKNSEITWNYLHNSSYVDNMLQLSNEDSNMPNCIVMKAKYDDIASIIEIHQPAFCQYLQESYIHFFPYPDVTHFLSVFTDLFKLPQLNILHVTISLLSNTSEYDIDDESLEKVISTNHNITELFVSLYNIPQCNTLINSILTGVKRNDTIQFFSLSCNSCDNTTISSLQVEKLLTNNQTLQGVKLNILSKETHQSLRVTPCIKTLDINITTYPIKKTDILSPGLKDFGRNITNLRCLSLQDPLTPLGDLFGYNPFLQQLDIVLNKIESFIELFNILSSITTITALRIRNGFSLDRQFVLCDEVGQSLQLMLSSNQTLKCLEIKIQKSILYLPVLPFLPVEYLTAGLKENHTLQELDIYFKLPVLNFREFFETTNNLKSLTVSFYESRLWMLSNETFLSRYHEEIIPHITYMLNKNKDMKFLQVKFLLYVSFRITIKDNWKAKVHQFWEAVLLHPSLCYIYVHICNQFMIDILNNLKESLIAQREEKKLGPPPVVEFGNISRSIYKPSHNYNS